MDPIRIAVAEDNLLVREGLLALLGSLSSVEVVASATDLPELLAAVDEHRPDVVLTDIRMPPSHTDEGVQAATTFRSTVPDMGVVVVSQFAEPAYALAVLDEGSRGRGYVLKDRIDDLGHLQRAIESVHAGGSFIDEDVVDALINARTRTTDSVISQLTPRELEVLTEIARGRNNAGVAAALHVSEHAVEKHTNAIFSKLGLSGDEHVNRRVKAVLLYLAGVESDR
ncbi:MAG: response regulator transcription factor [Actinomycetota bacterium]